MTPPPKKKIVHRPVSLSWWIASQAGHTFKSSKGTLGNESTCSLQPSAAPKAKMFYDSVTNV